MIKLKHKMSRDQYNNLQVDGEIEISLEPNEVNLLNSRYGNFYTFSRNKIKMN